jgi:hypothetical protein
MNLNYCNVDYRTEPFDDPNAGCAGLDLLASAKGETTRVGRITFWDASGQFYIQLTGAEAPLEVVDRFIAEAKQIVSVE